MIDNLITLNCEQGTEEWLTARLGIPTATGVSNIVTPSGKKSSAWTSYLAELVAESIEGLTEGYKSTDMLRGNQLEEQARMAYEFATGNDVVQVGGVYRNADKDMMISPDGLIPTLRKGLEIKCPKMKTHIKYIIEGVVPSEYIIQVQVALWVTGYDSWDFVSYCPEYQKQTLFIHTAERDPVLMKAFDKYIPQFIETLKAFRM
ncbi:YqaJ viral recombinase family protein [Glaesserella parasuis]|uniref:YqaJ viral recombinase family protein n=1 Tax=Glaesserella parasuis TaxID=738 RepID=A0AAJ6D991_GLAPU|nr:YqaJ viral recombinase family protein [Glaesserella parasuis]MDO9795713.1 YqaJ viral recombinase family protein [Glaesserella parasuis]MDO9901306.1 YqaJ viral recombinase family protein [Glaesserella parasuis]MDO9960597.1 YqaJ viral recombinase family protein [Glaesserella parasuis]MDP0341021.1 YqaJ viral recombinase family protein [Glaesserella parasuis]MDP0356382.1 YqaJ viral recombinase family protein [Glaesserella parasuis]